ncbi:MAG: DUF4968 domain-containing protein, partial [Lacibacter sp.]
MRLHLLLVLLFAVATSQAQTWQKANEGIKTTINNVDVEIQFYTASTVRIIKSPAGTFFNKKSLSVIAAPQQVKLNIKEQASLLTVKSEKLIVKCNLTSGAISFYTNSGTVLLNEKENGTPFKPFNDAGSSTYNIEQDYVLDKEEAIYGLGQQQQGKMVQRNLKLNMVQG